MDNFLSDGSVGISTRKALKAALTLCVRFRSLALAACLCLLSPVKRGFLLRRFTRRVSMTLVPFSESELVTFGDESVSSSSLSLTSGRFRVGDASMWKRTGEKP